MVNRSAISRAHVVEFQEATEEEAFEFLKDHLGEVKFNEKKNELVDLVKNYSGGKFKTLVDVAKRVDDLQGKRQQLREDAKKDLVSYVMHSPKEELVKEDRKKAKKAIVMKDIGNHIVKNGNIDRGLLTRKLLGTMGEEELRRTN
ncbi:hypothetical protein LTR94_027903, partial [Friedmanniomyces endolithicus]